MKRNGSRRGVKGSASLCVSPEKRLCSKFDPTGIARFRTADPDRMGVRVVDDCGEEHIM